MYSWKGFCEAFAHSELSILPTMTVLPLTQWYLRWRFSRPCMVCAFHMPGGGRATCAGLCVKSDSGRAASEPVTPSSLVSALMCCLILTGYSFSITPGCSRRTAGWLRTRWSAAYINTQSYHSPSSPAPSLNSIFMFHLVNTDGNIQALEMIRCCLLVLWNKVLFVISW